MILPDLRSYNPTTDTAPFRDDPYLAGLFDTLDQVQARREALDAEIDAEREVERTRRKRTRAKKERKRERAEAVKKTTEAQEETMNDER